MVGCHIVSLNDKETEVGIDFRTRGWSIKKILPSGEARRVFKELQMELGLSESQFR